MSYIYLNYVLCSIFSPKAHTPGKKAVFPPWQLGKALTRFWLMVFMVFEENCLVELDNVLKQRVPASLPWLLLARVLAVTT